MRPFLAFRGAASVGCPRSRRVEAGAGAGHADLLGSSLPARGWGAEQRAASFGVLGDLGQRDLDVLALLLEQLAVLAQHTQEGGELLGPAQTS